MRTVARRRTECQLFTAMFVPLKIAWQFILSIASVRRLQGYYFSKPLAAHEVGDKLRAGHPEVQIQAQAQAG